MQQTEAQNIPESIYDFEVEGLEGNQINFNDFKGKKILIVNTASKCGFTPQYEDLEKLHQMFPDDLVVIGFPANNFMRQEPGSNEEIATFCERNYGVTFPMATKISVKGKDQHPLYTWLTDKEYNKVKKSKVKWNFQKYLISEEGQLLEVYGSKVNPLDPEILEAIKN